MITNDRYECQCPVGWRGDDCDQDVNECVADTGEETGVCNNGICVNTPGSYDCYCKPGYTGNNCNNEYDECLSNPCIHGTCFNLVNNYSCSCDPGFRGRTIYVHY